ncbi:sodium/glutamate symporter [Bartonella sp. DGB1]|uniref:sodium/glutamate symporter n=1 Tax=Bartonella sp. DGB1 TaxID=3239807 RepID=UPI0035234E2F
MVVQLNSLETLFLASLCLLLGVHLKRRSSWLQRFCIPAPVAGGFIASILFWIGNETGLLDISFNNILQPYLMVAFFILIGLGGSFRLLRSGGRLLLVYLGICWFLVVSQTYLGLSLATMLGLDPILGIMTGGVSLTGGHGGAAAFGTLAAEYGHERAVVVAIATATFGLFVGGLLGGPVASYLINRHKVPIKVDALIDEKKIDKKSILKTLEGVSLDSFIKMLAVVLGIMVVSIYLIIWIEALIPGFRLPNYSAGMIVAIIFRNLNDYFNVVKLDQPSLELISNSALGLFLTMAMLTLKIWELKAVALPLLVIWLVQVIFLVSLTVFVVFRLLGKNYDAAVMCSGLIGHGFGAQPNAVANMTSVCEQYKALSVKAFRIVPITGSILIDIVGVPFLSWIIVYLA